MRGDIMLDYTKAAILKIQEDLRKLLYWANLIMQLVYIVYLVYAVATRAGVMLANIVLLAISVLYLGFFIFISIGAMNKLKKKTRKVVGLVYKRSKQTIKFFTLGVMLYSIYATANQVTPISVIFSAFMIVSWLVPIVLEFLYKYFTARAQLFMEGLTADFEFITKPAKSVGNFFKKMSGKEIEPEKEKTDEQLRARAWLDKKVEESRNERAEDIAESKRKKKQEKQEKKLAKKQAKADKKNTVFIPEEDEIAPPEMVEVFEE